MSCCARASTNYGTVLSIERFNHNGRGSGVSPRQKIHTNGASYLTVFHGKLLLQPVLFISPAYNNLTHNLPGANTLWWASG
jgi:hypothetical protein